MTGRGVNAACTPTGSLWHAGHSGRCVTMSRAAVSSPRKALHGFDEVAAECGGPAAVGPHRNLAIQRNPVELAAEVSIENIANGLMLWSPPPSGPV